MENFRSILVIKSGAIGDLIAGTTAIRALRNAFPASSITALANPLMREICPPGTLVDDIVDLDPRSAGPAAYLRAAREIRRRKFGLAVNLRWSSEMSAVLTWMSGAPVRLGAGPPSSRRMYTEYVPPSPGRRHEFLRHLDIVRPVTGPPGEPDPFLRIGEEDERRADAFLSAPGLAVRTFLIVHPGASTSSKAWLPERFAAAGRMFVDRFRAAVIVTWGPGERDLAESVVRLAGSGAHLAPATTIGMLGALVRSARVCLCNYSGVMNIAMAVGTPVLAVGCTSPEDWGPYGPRNATVNAARSYDSYTDVERRAAMDSIPVEEVWQALAGRWTAVTAPQQSVAS
jgi:ADP-heptose:LPS heptosyltransferase